jgi:purine-nucleoside phosphorylase
MEAAALYAFAVAKGQQVICFAHITNQMGSVETTLKKVQKEAVWMLCSSSLKQRKAG